MSPFGSMSSPNAGGSGYIGSVGSIGPSQLWPATPSPMPQPYPTSGISFGMPQPAALPQVKEGSTSPTSGTTTVAAAVQPAAVAGQQVYYMPMQGMPGTTTMMMQAPPQMQAVQMPAVAGQVPVMMQAVPGAMPGMVMMAPQPQAAPGAEGAEAATTGVTVVPAAGSTGSPTTTAAVMGSARTVMVQQAPATYIMPGADGIMAPMAEGGTNLGPVGTPQLPSVGSTFHDGTGRCSPCAWFWKPRGCQSGAQCGYCHLCPEGELKNRKKAKVAAIRMGAIEPAPRNSVASGVPGAARGNLKLATLVQQ